MSGGTAGYTYLWTPPPATGQGTPDATGFCAGPVNVLITDANGCTLTVSFVIDDAVPMQLSLQLTPASCPSTCDGAAGVIVTGGVGGYVYAWSPQPGGGQGTASATGLCPQAYSLTVTDAAGCDTTISFTITAPPPIVPNATQTDVTCAGECDGTITLAPTGGNGTFTYLWVPAPPAGQGTATASQLCAGEWRVTITSGGCDTTITFTITEPAPITVDLVTTDASCPGVCDGTATASASGGTGVLSYSWSPVPGTGQGTASVSGLCPGPHTLTVTDAAGCDTTITFIINEPLPITATQSQTDLTCGGTCDGTASVVAAGGAGGFVYVWTPQPGGGQGTANATDLCVGPISVAITDANGCSITVPFTIQEAAPMQLSLQLTPASCPGTCDGTAGVIATGGVGGYVYAWSPQPGGGQGTASATGLCAQAYSLTVTDAGGCDTTISFTITAPPPIAPNATQTDVTCAGECDGTITLAPTGGNGTFTYLWAPTPPIGQGTATASQLCAGDWRVTITSGGCDTTITFTITEPAPITVDLVTTDASCAGECDGTATANASGGTGTFTYLWSPVPGAGQGTASVSGLCPGPYTVTVADAAGCDTTLTFTINEPPPITATVTTTPETCAGPCTGTATLAHTGGTGNISIDWQPPPGGGQGTLTATGLCAGTNYTVTLTDDNGCTTTSSFTIDPSAVIIPNISSTPVTCYGRCDGAATVGPTGGTPNYTHVWSPPPPIGQGTPSVSGLCPGVVRVTITDATGCSVTAEVLILEPPPIITDVTINDPRCAGVCDGSIILNTSGGGSGYTYAWSPQPPHGQGTNTITGLCGGTWNVLITDAAGCTQSASYTTTEPAPLTLAVSTTPSQCQVCIGTATAVFGGGNGSLSIEWTDALGATVGNSETITGLCAGIYTATVRDGNGCDIHHVVAITDSDGEALTVTNGTTSCPNTCDGSVSVAYTCSDPACLVAWSDADGNVIATGVDVLGGLCPGEYYVAVTNASGCITIDTALVVAPVVVTLNISSSPVSCSGECDGTATVGVANGTPSYSFTWSPQPGTGQGMPNVTGLCADVYEVTVRDGNGCETVAQVLITEPAPISLFTSIVIDASCAGRCDGNITLAPTGGSGNYTYAWSPAPVTGQGSSAAFGFCAGNVSVTITDDNGCQLQRTFTITEPQPLVVSTSTTQSTCPNCDGTATATVTGGTGAYEYSWMLGTTEVSTDAMATGLCGGVYNLTVRDDYGCSAQAVVQVSDSNAEILNVTGGNTSCANTCDGAVEVDFTCSVADCTIQWTDALGNVLGQDAQLTSLCTGTYTVQVTNGAGCVSLADAVVAPSTTIIPNLSTSPVTCPGACDGMATVGPTGGVGSYTYVWSPEPGSGQGTAHVTGLCAGVYEVLITDASGCGTTVHVLITGPSPITEVSVVRDVACFGACDGSIIVTAAGGTGAHTFTWDPEPPNGQGSNGAFDLCAGTYALTITDANGCAATFSYTITEPSELVASGGSVSSECGVCNGEALVSATGGTGPYTHVWTLVGAIYGTGDTLGGICAGLYHVLTTDAVGCTVSILVPVQDRNGEVLATVGDTTSCPGVCDGVAEVLFNCGTPDCTVAWYSASGSDLGLSTERITDLCGGLYLATVTNGIGCLSIDTAIVAEPDPIIANLSTTPVTCFGDCDGTATVGPTGGVGSYDYLWDPPPAVGQGTPHAEGFCAGQAQVTITDDAGCSIDVPFLILGPDLLTATADVIPITCNGACDGTIVITAQGGTGVYTFNWITVPSNGQGGNAGTQLCAGEWICIVSDANGCETTVTVTLEDPPLLEAAIATTDNACFGLCEGTAALTITGGVAPHTIVWTDATGAVIANDVVDVGQLCAGGYNARITDDNGCAINMPFTITEGAPIVANLVFTGETCAGPCDGTAGVAPTGGAGSYTYLWQPGGEDTDQVTGLCAGNHAITITDLLGCDTTVAFTLLPYTPIADNAAITDVLCNAACNGSVVTDATGGIGALTYTWTPVPANGQGDTLATGLCPGEYLLVITDGVGCDSTFTYTITEPPVLELVVNTLTDASCPDAADGAIATTAFGGWPSYTFAWSGPAGFTAITEDITGLDPGDYHLLLTDANNCVIDTTITVGALVSVIADAGADQQVCSGTGTTLDGSASSGAATWSWRDADGVEIGNTPTIDLPALPDGDHVFTLVVTDGPCTSTDQVTVTWMALPIADAGADRTIFLSETTTLGGTPAGPPGATFTWSPDSLLNDASVPNPVATPMTTTWFALTVVAPNGCVDTDSVLVSIAPTVVIPNGFTPNGDGRNDTWQIDFIELFPDCVVEVYNRWGEQLFRSAGYTKPWDGRYRDGLVPVGTYYYVIELNDERFPEPYTGPLTVIR
ncbi:MAG: gliding motility-associated C-terminal domain-containing protein [Flavobacteriales bacterium]|nr:gliding motility-associated C-terminal domain-containing protein [Flavobacteriales bacterium]